MMSGRWVASLLSLLAAAHSFPQPSAADQQQPSAADRVSALLEPMVKAAVLQELAGQQQCGVDQRTLGRLEERLEAVALDVAALTTAVASIQDAAEAGRNCCGAGQEPEPEPEPACERQPEPLPVVAAPHLEPAVRACARSCLQLRDRGGSPQDGVYWLTGLPVPVLCDFTHDEGGWTLLLTAASRDGWDLASVLQYNERSPSLTDNYSILRYADTIRDLGNGSRFAYRIETQAQTDRQRWGGMWFAPRHYSFVDETGTQTEVRLVRKFDKWVYKDTGIEKRMPWLRSGDDFTVLTTTGVKAGNRWGTLVLNKVQAVNWQHSPWIHGGSEHTGTVLYWMREEEL